MTRYSFVRALCALILLIAPGIALSQAFPSRAIRIFVPYTTGGSPDTVARIVGQKMGSMLGQSIVVENISGGSGMPAIRSLLSSRPDGYSLILLDAGHWAINPAGRSSVPYDPEKSFTPVGMVTTQSLFLAVHKLVPANNLPELIALIKKNPGVYSYGSGGIGSVHHLTVEVMKQELGLDIVHIPFRGMASAVPALVAGNVQIAVSALNSITQYEKAGMIKILGANTAARSPLAPEVPSISTVVPNFDFPGQIGLLGPVGMPKEVVDKLAQTLAEAIKTPEVIAALNKMGLEPAASSAPDALAKRIQSDRAKYGAIMKSLGIKLE